MLNKEICAKCKCDIDAKGNIDTWSSDDNMRWSYGKVFCPALFRAGIKGRSAIRNIEDMKPPCKYLVEQLIVGNTNDIHS